MPPRHFKTTTTPGGRPRRALIQSMVGCASTADWRSMRGVGDVSVIGCVGSLIVATRGVAGVGEVLLNVRGTKEAYLAWSEQPLPRGSEVRGRSWLSHGPARVCQR